MQYINSPRADLSFSMDSRVRQRPRPLCCHVVHHVGCIACDHQWRGGEYLAAVMYYVCWNVKEDYLILHVHSCGQIYSHTLLHLLKKLWCECNQCSQSSLGILNSNKLTGESQSFMTRINYCSHWYLRLFGRLLRDVWWGWDLGAMQDSCRVVILVAFVTDEPLETSPASLIHRKERKEMQ